MKTIWNFNSVVTESSLTILGIKIFYKPLVVNYKETRLDIKKKKIRYS